MEDRLRQRVVGQDAALAAVPTRCAARAPACRTRNRPIGSFLFLGPTGVGKTELARALAEFLFDDEHAMVRIDMSEYMEKHTVSRLIGAPPGYVGYDEGGQLTEPVRRRPYSVVLFDEIEKAHPDVFNVLLQVLDDGRLTDGQGRTVDFKNTVVIMTTNIGSQYLRELNADNRAAVERQVDEELRSTSGPSSSTASTRSSSSTRSVASSSTASSTSSSTRFAALLAERGLELEVTPAARELLAERGYDPEYGARPLKRGHPDATCIDPLANAHARAASSGPATGSVADVDSARGAITFSRQRARSTRRHEQHAMPRGPVQGARRQAGRQRRRDQEGLPQAGQASTIPTPPGATRPRRPASRRSARPTRSLGDAKKRAEYDAMRAGPRMPPGFAGGAPAGCGMGSTWAACSADVRRRRRPRRRPGGRRRRRALHLLLERRPAGGDGFAADMPFEAPWTRRPRRLARAPPRRPPSAAVRASDGSPLVQRGSDVYSDVRIAIDQAVLGTVADVATLTGRATVKIPPGTSSGVKLRLKRQGDSPAEATAITT